MKERDYQLYGIEAIFAYFRDGGMGNPIVAMPTGTGKSHVIGGFIQRACMNHVGTRILMLTHVKELIEQNAQKLLAVWPTCPLGIISAGLNRREYGYPVTYAGIGSVYRRPDLLGKVDLVIVDECHTIGTDADSMYRKTLHALKQRNSAVKVIGLTATHYRMGQGSLLDEGGIFDDVCVDMTSLEAFNWFIEEGYLAPLVPRPTELEYDLDNVGVQNGDYKNRQLQEAVDQDKLTQAAVTESLALGELRDCWLVFASGIDHAVHVAEAYCDRGESATFIHSKLPAKERTKRLEDFKAGKYRIMVNNGILTTGFDHPGIDMIVMLRPTRSPGLWVQMLGRGTRPVYAPGFNLATKQGRLDAIAAGPKHDCLVLDFARNTARLGPINDPVLPKPRGKKRKQEAPIRLCENCNTYCHASLRVCPHCGFEFPRKQNLYEESGTEELVKKKRKPDPVVEDFVVDRITYATGQRDGRPPYLRVSYYCGLRRFNEVVALEHEGYPGIKAKKWWLQRGTIPVPETVEQSLERLQELKPPRTIRVWVNKKYPEVLSHEFTTKQEQAP